MRHSKKLVSLLLICWCSACQASDLEIAEAFATFDRDELEAFIADRPNVDFASYRYGRSYNIVQLAVANRLNPSALFLAHQAGGDVNHQDQDTRTPLHNALDADLYVTTQILLALGARTDLINVAGQTMMDFCSSVLASNLKHLACKALIPD